MLTRKFFPSFDSGINVKLKIIICVQTYNLLYVGINGRKKQLIFLMQQIQRTEKVAEWYS